MSQQITTQLGTLTRKDLTEAIDELARLEEAAVEAEGDYKVAYAAAVKNGEASSVASREYDADIACGGLWKAYKKAAAEVRVQQASIKALHTRISVGQTLAQSEKFLSGVGT